MKKKKNKKKKQRINRTNAANNWIYTISIYKIFELEQKRRGNGISGREELVINGKTYKTAEEETEIKGGVETKKSEAEEKINGAAAAAAREGGWNMQKDDKRRRRKT